MNKERNHLENLIYFNELPGNHFENIQNFCKESRQISKKYNIMESKALTYALYEEVPDDVHKSKIEIPRTVSYADLVLSNVSNPLIINSVKESLKQSTPNNTNYVYDSRICDADKSRVRILVNMILNNT